MELEFECTDEVMLAQVSGLLRIVITIIDFDFVLLRLLEVEVNSPLLDPGRVQVVVDHLSLTKFLPYAARLLVKHGERI